MKKIIVVLCMVFVTVLLIDTTFAQGRKHETREYVITDSTMQIFLRRLKEQLSM